MDKNERASESFRGVTCPECQGVGFVRIALPNGRFTSSHCRCQVERRVIASLQRTGIPTRYEHCTLDNFDASFTGADKSLSIALLQVRGLVTNYPLENLGILLVGTIGAGKTHLAVGALKELVSNRGAQGLFCDYREFLRQIQNTYNPQVPATELELLQPVMDAEVLVLDDLGATRPSEWVWDTVALVLNSRYNSGRTTIITTNYPARPAGAGDHRAETLGDRIGDRMRSRLIEMCRIVEMNGEDYREKKTGRG